MKRIFYFLLFFIALYQIGLAQNGLHTQNLYNTVNSQSYQPANLALRANTYTLNRHNINVKKWFKAKPDTTVLPILLDSIQTVLTFIDMQQVELDKSLTLVGLTGSGFIGNNRFGMGGILKDGNYLSTETIEAAVGKMGDKNRFQMGSSMGFVVNLPIKNKNAWGLSYDYHTAFSVGTSAAGTAGLIFRGNAPYAGTPVTDANIFFNNQAYHSLGLAWARSMDKWSFGLKGKFIAGQKSANIAVKDFAFFTSEIGDSVHINGDYQYFVSDRNAPLDGFGAGLDIGAIYQVKENLSIGASLTDIGFVAWSGEKMAKDVSQSYTGFQLKDLLDLQDNPNGQNELIDSLKALVFSDTTKITNLNLLPTTLHINAVYDWARDNRAFASLHYSFTNTAPISTLPMFAVGYQRRICSGFSAGINAYGGGLDTYGVGVMGMSYFRIKKKNPVSIVYSMDNILGLVGAKGVCAEVGISMGF